MMLANYPYIRRCISVLLVGILLGSLAWVGRTFFGTTLIPLIAGVAAWVAYTWGVQDEAKRAGRQGDGNE